MTVFMLQTENDTMQMGRTLLQTMHSPKLIEKGFSCIAKYFLEILF